jgi:hypothetical protein
MNMFRSLRLLLMALLLAIVPASSFAGVFISVGFAPPILPVYDVPQCPEDGWIWTPGYWAYGPDGYYWVPGAWVPAPYEGALWTPGYWGFSGGQYVFHNGYWGNHVGYYGGVNYGGGYFGIGFVGGMWRGHDFFYNRAVLRIDDRFGRHGYEDRGIIGRYTVANDRHVAFSGGPGGIRHDPGPEERMAEHEQHMAATSFQHTHESSAMSDRGSYFRNNQGRPANPAMQRPMGYNGSNNNVRQAPGGYNANPGAQQQQQRFQQQQHLQQQRVQPQQPQVQQRPQAVQQQVQQPQRQQFQQQPQVQQRPQAAPQQQQRPQPQVQQHAQPQAQPAQHAAPQAQRKDSH